MCLGRLTKQYGYLSFNKANIKALSLYLWQFPQNVLGAILIKITGAVKTYLCIDERNRKHIVYYLFKKGTQFNRIFSGGLFGNVILLSDNNNDEKTVRHEYGHSLQSCYSGWLYLPVIGVYSAVFCNLWDRRFHRSWPGERRTRWYYSRWSEAWADKLGGVKRI
jgi:hypothetical protein